ncbi:MAG: helix-turn-helix domain-containing protein [Fimbriimonadaceae bacterium]|nr:helix-turn-helix domain-containing protein [Fimbriimonadaceae bacterium]
MKHCNQTSLPQRMTIRQAAESKNLSTKTIRRYISSGRLTAYRVGPRAIRVDRDSLLALDTLIGCDTAAKANS